MPSTVERTTSHISRPGLPTPHHPKGTFSVHSTTRISAPSSVVFSVLLDSTTYPKWNTFCPRLTFHTPVPKPSSTNCNDLFVGLTLTEHTYLLAHGKGPCVPQGMLVTYLGPIQPSDRKDGRTGTRIVFQNASFPTWLLWSERVQDVLDVDVQGQKEDEECVYETWDSMGGPLGWVVLGLLGPLLRRRFWDWAEDLRVYAEGRARG